MSRARLVSRPGGQPVVERARLLPVLLTVAAFAALLLAESFLPARVLLPLAPGDFPAWGLVENARRHPHPNYTMSDVAHLFVPGLAVTREAADRGVLPLWDPTQALGVPHVHQVHYGVFYPPAWIAVGAGLRGLAALALLHVLVAGWGTALYLRELRRTTLACCAGALAFAGSAWVTARLQAFPTVGALVWLPWVLYGLERGAAVGGGRPRVIAAAALALSFLAGFPQITMWLVLLAALIETVRLAVRAGAREPALRPFLANAGALLLGLGLAMPQVLPTVDYMLTESQRGATTPEDVATQGLEWPLLWHLLAPDRYAAVDFAGHHPIALQDLEQAKLPVAVNRPETSMGIGALGALLALLAMVFGRTWRTRLFAALVIGVFALLLSPAALEFASRWFPPLRYGSPKRLLALTTFALAVLAAGGLDLVRGRRLAVTVTAWLLSVGLAVTAAAGRLTVPPAGQDYEVDQWAGEIADRVGPAGTTVDDVFAMIPREHFVAAAEAAARSATIAFVAGFVAVLVFRPRRERSQAGWRTLAQRLPLLIAVVLGLELLFGAWPLLRSVSAPEVTADAARPGPLLVPDLAAEARALAAEGDAPPRLARLGAEPHWLRPNFPSLYGLQDVQCYAPMAPRRVVELLQALDPDLYASGSAIAGFTSADALERPAIDMLGVRVLLTDRPETPAGFVERAVTGPVRVLENVQALPRAWLASPSDVLAVTEPAERLQLLAADDFDPRRSVLLDLPDRPQVPPAIWRRLREAASARAADGAPLVDESQAAGRELELTRYERGRLQLDVGPGDPALLVVTETYHPGWRATVDGEEVQVWCANHAVLALPVWSPEEARVELAFDPPEVARGAWAGALAGAVAVALLFVRRRRR